MKRLIVKIDEEKCDGCGLCVPACAEGALQIVDGKARLVADNLCDGLGACLGHCPRGAIGVEEREAAPFAAPSPAPHEAPPSAVPSPTPHEAAPFAAPSPAPCEAAPYAVSSSAPAPRESVVPAQPLLACGCPGSALEERALPSLGNWPVQIHLVPPGASFLKNAHLVVAADCTAFACPDFHRRFLPGRALLVGCPKLDDARAYIDRLTAIISTAGPRAITVVYMEVPCCYGMTYVVQQALARAGATLPVDDVVITPAGEVRSTSAGAVR